MLRMSPRRIASRELLLFNRGLTPGLPRKSRACLIPKWELENHFKICERQNGRGEQVRLIHRMTERTMQYVILN